MKDADSFRRIALQINNLEHRELSDLRVLVNGRIEQLRVANIIRTAPDILKSEAELWEKDRDRAAVEYVWRMNTLTKEQRNNIDFNTARSMSDAKLIFIYRNGGR